MSAADLKGVIVTVSETYLSRALEYEAEAVIVLSRDRGGPITATWAKKRHVPPNAPINLRSLGGFVEHVYDAIKGS